MTLVHVAGRIDRILETHQDGTAKTIVVTVNNGQKTILQGDRIGVETFDVGDRITAFGNIEPSPLGIGPDMVNIPLQTPALVRLEALAKPYETNIQNYGYDKDEYGFAARPWDIVKSIGAGTEHFHVFKPQSDNIEKLSSEAPHLKAFAKMLEASMETEVEIIDPSSIEYTNYYRPSNIYFGTESMPVFTYNEFLFSGRQGQEFVKKSIDTQYFKALRANVYDQISHQPIFYSGALTFHEELDRRGQIIVPYSLEAEFPTFAYASVGSMSLFAFPLRDLPSSDATKFIIGMHEVGHALEARGEERTVLEGENFADSFSILASVQKFEDLSAVESLVRAREAGFLFSQGGTHVTGPYARLALEHAKTLKEAGKLEDLSPKELLEEVKDFMGKAEKIIPDQKALVQKRQEFESQLGIKPSDYNNIRGQHKILKKWQKAVEKDQVPEALKSVITTSLTSLQALSYMPKELNRRSVQRKIADNMAASFKETYQNFPEVEGAASNVHYRIKEVGKAIYMVHAPLSVCKYALKADQQISKYIKDKASTGNRFGRKLIHALKAKVSNRGAEPVKPPRAMVISNVENSYYSQCSNLTAEEKVETYLQDIYKEKYCSTHFATNPSDLQKKEMYLCNSLAFLEGKTYESGLAVLHDRQISAALQSGQMPNLAQTLKMTLTQTMTPSKHPFPKDVLAAIQERSANLCKTDGWREKIQNRELGVLAAKEKQAPKPETLAPVQGDKKNRLSY